MKSRLLIFIAAVSLLGWSAQSSAAADSGNRIYRSECGACHVAYPAVFLTTASWRALLNHLDDHFGDNAELAAADLSAIESFLQRNSYDNSAARKRYGSRFDTPGAPLRVSETLLFRAVHEEVPDRLVKNNPAVKSWSRCEACHKRAQQGNFDEDEVHIPR